MLGGRTLLNFRSHFGRSLRTASARSGTSSRSGRIPSNSSKLTLLGGSTIAVLVWTLPTECAAETEFGADASGSKEDDEVSKEVDEVETLIVNTLAPLGKKLGTGGFMGFLSGYALKYVGKLAAIVVGTGFVALQVAQYKGLIDIDFGVVEAEVTKVLDADGDGELTSKDLVIWWRQLKGILTHSLPSTSGFSAGFALGIYYG